MTTRRRRFTDDSVVSSQAGRIDLPVPLETTKTQLPVTKEDLGHKKLSTLECLGRINLAAWAVILCVLLERGSWYGIRLTMIEFMTTQMGQSPNVATIYYQISNFLCYFITPVGAFLCIVVPEQTDSYLGVKKSFVIAFIPWVLGAALIPLTAYSENPILFCLASCLFAAGSGLMKSSQAVLGARQLDENEPEEVRAMYFRFFYGSVQVGSIVTSIVIPMLGNATGWPIAYTV
ncbi:MAG: hypothetical protein MHM6MM_005353 [Cercozoa sp. M6MM]